MKVPGLASLSELITTTADELRDIRNHPPPPGQAVMSFTECEIEVAAVVGADADGKVKFWVIEAGASAKYENSHKINLKFKAIDGTVQAEAVTEGVADVPKGPKGGRP